MCFLNLELPVITMFLEYWSTSFHMRPPLSFAYHNQVVIGQSSGVYLWAIYALPKSNFVEYNKFVNAYYIIYLEASQPNLVQVPQNYC